MEKPLSPLPETHLLYFHEAKSRLRAGQAAWEFFMAVCQRDLELPDGTQITDDGELISPALADPGRETSDTPHDQ